MKAKGLKIYYTKEDFDDESAYLLYSQFYTYFSFGCQQMAYNSIEDKLSEVTTEKITWYQLAVAIVETLKEPLTQIEENISNGDPVLVPDCKTMSQEMELQELHKQFVKDNGLIMNDAYTKRSLLYDVRLVDTL